MMNSTTLYEEYDEFVPRGVVTTHPVFVNRAQGSQMWDIHGNEFIDFAGGIGVLNVGHRHPKVIDAARGQLDKYAHICFQVALYEPYVQLAKRLAGLAPGNFEKKVLLLNSGAEAVENAVKIARAFTGRPAVIAFDHSFHGRTLMALALTGKASPYKQNFGPLAAEVYHTPYPYEYRGWDTERALAALQQVFETEVEANRVAAIIMEPVLGEGGFVPAPVTFIKKVKELTEQHGILLIADEIQTGVGRTGTMWAIEHSGVAPDIMTVAKSIAGGFPLSAVIGRRDVMDAPQPGGLGGTYGGHPVACAAALAVLDVVEEEEILKKAQHVGDRLMDNLKDLQSHYVQIGDVRGLGAMVAIELVRDRQTKTPAPELADRIIATAREYGLLLLRAGLYGNVVRLLAPLLIEEGLLNRALERLNQSCADVLQSAD